MTHRRSPATLPGMERDKIIIDAKSADRRVMLSRRTLRKFDTFPGAWAGGPEHELALVSTEIGILRSIAEAHPDKAEKIDALVAKWEAFAGKLRAKMS